MTLRLGLVGSRGRMGLVTKELLKSDPWIKQYELALEIHGDTKSTETMLKNASLDCVIDFSTPSATLQWSKLAGALKLPYLCCTTGFTETQAKQLAKSLSKSAWGHIQNTSLGVAVLKLALQKVANLLPKDYNFSVFDAHHKYKKDSPSGTAKILAQAIESESHHAASIHSVKGGTETGLHRVLVLGPYERLEFEHAAQDRRLFAEGALRLMSILHQKRARAQGYTVEELIFKDKDSVDRAFL